MAQSAGLGVVVPRPRGRGTLCCMGQAESSRAPAGQAPVFANRQLKSIVTVTWRGQRMAVTQASSAQHTRHTPEHGLVATFALCGQNRNF